MVRHFGLLVLDVNRSSMGLATLDDVYVGVEHVEHRLYEAFLPNMKNRRYGFLA